MDTLCVSTFLIRSGISVRRRQFWKAKFESQCEWPLSFEVLRRFY